MPHGGDGTGEDGASQSVSFCTWHYHCYNIARSIEDSAVVASAFDDGLSLEEDLLHRAEAEIFIWPLRSVSL